MPYGGKYRIIDFPLSNCVNSGIETVGVLTQYQPLELNDYIGSGQPWDCLLYTSTRYSQDTALSVNLVSLTTLISAVTMPLIVGLTQILA